MPSPRTAVTLLALCSGLLAVSGPAVADDATEAPPTADLIRLLPPHGATGRGKLHVETLVLDTVVDQVVFYLDGEEVDRRKRPPFAADLAMAEPARPQRVRVEALDRRGRLVGEDEMTVNRVERPLFVGIEGLERRDDGVDVAARISVPDGVEVERVELYVDDRKRAELGPEVAAEGRLRTALPLEDPRQGDYVRVVVVLADGRLVEDAGLIASDAFEEALAVRLVQLQVVVTDRDERPLTDLGVSDFSVFEGGSAKTIDRVYRSDDVALVLGLAIDASASMERIWPETKEAARAFLHETLGRKDRAFVVDFDADTRLRQPLTGDLVTLLDAVDEVRPEGGTALFDSILFSLLQFERRPGRRGLVVITDGLDSRSLTDPERTIDFGLALGVPVYVIALSPRGGPSSPWGGPLGGGGLGGGANAAVHSLHRLTDPTGGRLYRPPNQEGVLRALAQIRNELASQYVITYYSDVPPGEELPEIEVEVDRPKVEVKVALAVD